jgi:carboxyl-terminal processing protease
MLNSFLKKYRTLILVASISASSIITWSFVDDFFEVSKSLDIFSSTFREVNMYYVDSIQPGKLMKTGIDAMLETLDPYTNFIPESEVDDYRFMTTGQYGGIGALIRQKGDYVAISEPYEGFPAHKADIRAGDEIMEIDGMSTKGKKTDEVSRLLKGQPKTQVKLQLRRLGEKDLIEKVLTREEIKVKSVPYYGMLDNEIGYIRLSHFTDNCGNEVKEALTKLKEKNPKGIILDLRYNPGGLLNEAVNVSNVFIERGQEIVSTRGKMKSLDRSYKAINTPLDTEIPLAVLVNSGSASASEIVSGAIQDLDRGVIIGQRTFGKGLVQTTRMLGYNSQLKITTSKYYVPSGRCIQALDYTHRNTDGSVGKIPDSLVTEFKTRTGRKVYDGGGILPDVVVEQDKLSNITASLISKNIIFDFASQYRNQHPAITAAKVFHLSENDWNDFISFIADKDYDYTTKSEKSLEELKKNSEDEKYLEALKSGIEELKLKLAHDKKEDVDKNKEEISNVIEQEIVSRYYFQSGKIEASFHHDDDLQKALEILGNPSTVSTILNGTFKASSEPLKK